MSEPTLKSDSLAGLLSRYARSFRQQKPDEGLLDQVQDMLPRIDDPGEFKTVAMRLWDEFSCVDVPVMVAILRRWLEVEPTSVEARRCLGSYLLLHGPDWDHEANRLLHSMPESSPVS